MENEETKSRGKLEQHDSNGNIRIAIPQKAFWALITVVSLGGGTASSLGSRFLEGGPPTKVIEQEHQERDTALETRVTNVADRVSNIYGQLGQIRNLLEEIKAQSAEDKASILTTQQMQTNRLNRLERQIDRVAARLGVPTED